MKKNKLIVAIMAVVLCFACLFTACKKEDAEQPEVEPDTVFTKQGYRQEEINLYSSATLLSAYNGYNVGSRQGQLILFSLTTDGSTTRRVYNLAEEKEVLSVVDTELSKYDITLAQCYDVKMGTFIIVIKSIYEKDEEETVELTGYEASMYDAKGSFVAKVTGEEDDPTEVWDAVSRKISWDVDFIAVEDDIYNISDEGTITKASWGNELSGEIPEVDGKYGDYYYILSDSRVIIYDKQMNVKAYVLIPSYAGNSVTGIMENGSVFLQYVVRKDAGDTDYDFVTTADLSAGRVRGSSASESEPVRYSLTQKIIAVDGSVKDVNFGYYLITVLGRSTLENEANGFNTQYKNFGIGYKIDNKNIDMSPAAIGYYVINEEGEVITSIGSSFTASAVIAEAVTADRMVVTDSTERAYLYKFDGTLIGEVTNAKKFLPSYIIGKKSIFNYNLEKVYDYEANGFSYLTYLADSVLLTKQNENGDNEVYLFTGSAPVKVRTADQAINYNNGGEYYEICSLDEDGYVTSSDLYNYKGTKIASFDNEIIDNCAWGNVMIICTTDAEDILQYHLVK